MLRVPRAASGIAAPDPPPTSRPALEPKRSSFDVSHSRCRHHRGRRGGGRGDHQRGQPGGLLLDGPQPGPEGRARVGARVRRRRHPARRPRVGREGVDPLADHPGGRQDRPLRLRRARPVLRRPGGPDPADRQRGALLGRRRHRHVDHGYLARGRRDLRPGLGRADRGVDPPLLRDPGGRQGRLILLLRAQRRLGRLGDPHAREVRRGRRRVGASTARRRGPPTAASPTCTS